MYSFSITVLAPFDEVVDRTKEALAAEGFGVLTEIDMASTLKDRLNVDIAPYRILGACNPPLAHKAVSAEPSIGTLLPCNVVVRQDGDEVSIDFMDPAAVMAMTDDETVSAVGTEVRQKLQKVAHSLAAQ